MHFGYRCVGLGPRVLLVGAAAERQPCSSGYVAGGSGCTWSGSLWLVQWLLSYFESPASGTLFGIVGAVECRYRETLKMTAVRSRLSSQLIHCVIACNHYWWVAYVSCCRRIRDGRRGCSDRIRPPAGQYNANAERVAARRTRMSFRIRGLNDVCAQ